LNVDDSVCPPLREFGQRVPGRAASVKLRCRFVVPQGHALLPTVPALLCRWLPGDTPTAEAAAYTVPGLGIDGEEPEGLMVLGAGHGLRIRITGKPQGAGTGDATRVQVELAPAPIPVDAWEHPF
jgi:hypothetical protein